MEGSQHLQIIAENGRVGWRRVMEDRVKNQDKTYWELREQISMLRHDVDWLIKRNKILQAVVSHLDLEVIEVPEHLAVRQKGGTHD